jgi:hypothetical protein
MNPGPRLLDPASDTPFSTPKSTTADGVEVVGRRGEERDEVVSGR